MNPGEQSFLHVEKVSISNRRSSIGDRLASGRRMTVQDLARSKFGLGQILLALAEDF